LFVHIIKSLVENLKKNLDDWKVENQCVADLSTYAGQIPPALVLDYVWSLTQTYIGYVGGSAQFSRTDFFANGAAMHIPVMFEAFDDNAVDAFIETLRFEHPQTDLFGKRLSQSVFEEDKIDS